MVMQEVNLLEGLDPKVVDAISEITVEESHDEGSVLFERGEPALNFYILVKGSVELSIGEDGYVTHVVEKAGEAFGWSSLVDHHVFTASAVCAAPTKLQKISNKDLVRVFEKYPADGVIFYKRIAKIIGRRLATTYTFLLRTHGRTSRYLRRASSY
ncbi:MAG: cyclic nucleotide-binding domain-containing protein [Deltaproteobacteria bacterium]|nr:cyclic nucleotide-binding domain-containing protein [Deltaproteobacteria bacterium]